MYEYLQKMILAYFKEHNTYSTIDLSKRLGIPVERTVEIIEELIDLEEINIEDGTIVLTLKGRLKLQNEIEDFYVFDDYREIPKVNFVDRWDINRIYVPDRFMKKLK